MDISTLTLKIIILLVPGIIANKIYRRLVIRHKESTDLMFILTSVVFGLLSYLVLNFIFYCKGGLESFKTISESNIINYEEVFFGSIISILVGYLAALGDNKKWINKLALKFKISQKYGDENLYTRWLDDLDNSNPWVYIRDVEYCVIYSGRVSYYSETIDFREIGLSDVTVFDSNNTALNYEVPELYLCLPKDKIRIEKAIRIEKNGKEN